MAKTKPKIKNKINNPFVPHVNRTAANRCCRNPTSQKILKLYYL